MIFLPSESGSEFVSGFPFVRQADCELVRANAPKFSSSFGCRS